MIETLLSLVPDYGVFLVVAVVVLACLAVPFPSSAIVLTSGSFAASGDLSLATVLAATFLAHVAGDQMAFGFSQKMGSRLLNVIERSDRLAPVLEKSKQLLQQRGVLAVFLSHTLFSPSCPYVSYLSGAGGLSWHRFTFAAVAGAIVWTGTYVGLGFAFASQLEQVVEIISNFIGFFLAGCTALVVLLLLKRRWETVANAH